MKSSVHSHNQHGFTLIELLVSMAIFSVISVAIVGYIVDSLKHLGLESKATIASQELNNAVDLLQGELRMAASVSPYNVGTDPTVVTCSAQIAVTTQTLRFLVVHDDATSASGIKPYYVGYQYDPTTKILYRGEVVGTSTTGCTLPIGDPLAVGTRQILAKNIVAIDANGDGTNEPIFSFTTPKLSLNIGIQVTGSGGLQITQKVSDGILTRVL